MKIFLSIVGALCLIIPIYFLCLWLHASNVAGNYPKNVELYNSYLPEALRGRCTTSFIGLVFSVLAIVLNGFQFSRKNRSFKLFSLFVIIIAAILAFMNLWSMM